MGSEKFERITATGRTRDGGTVEWGRLSQLPSAVGIDGSMVGFFLPIEPPLVWEDFIDNLIRVEDPDTCCLYVSVNPSCLRVVHHDGLPCFFLPFVPMADEIEGISKAERLALVQEALDRLDDDGQ